MAVEEASRRRADGKSKTAGPRSTSVGRGNGFTQAALGGSPYAFNRIAIPLALSFAGKGFHSAQAAQIRAGCLRTAALRMCSSLFFSASKNIISSSHRKVQVLGEVN